MSQVTAENVCVDDRRRVVNAGVLHGRDATVKDTQATVDVGFAMTIVGSLATRGERLALIRVRVSGHDPGAIQNDALTVVEIDAEERIAAGVIFDLDDFDAAFAELDARYLAGEAAAHADTWSVIADVFVAHNQREIAAVTTDAVSLDHRRGAAFAPGEGFEYIRAGWDLDQNLNIYTETAHRLNDLGAVFTWAGHGTSHEGFVAEWRGVTLMTVDSEMVSRMEVFDEEISTPRSRFDDWTADATAQTRQAEYANDTWRASPPANGPPWRSYWPTTSPGRSPSRCERRSPTRPRRAHRWTCGPSPTSAHRHIFERHCDARGAPVQMVPAFNRGAPPGDSPMCLCVLEIDADERMVAAVSFELDDFDAALAELDARYLAGEAAAHAHTWSVIAGGFAALNRREIPRLRRMGEHRPPAGGIVRAGDGREYLRAAGT